MKITSNLLYTFCVYESTFIAIGYIPQAISLDVNKNYQCGQSVCRCWKAVVIVKGETNFKVGSAY